LAENAFWGPKTNAKMTALGHQAAYLEWKPHPKFGSKWSQFRPQKRLAEILQTSTPCTEIGDGSQILEERFSAPGL
jgi:hypothetical protein